MAPRTSSQFEEIREQSKSKILDAALKLFAEKGYENASISQIAKKAGVSKGLMYNYFRSKEDLVTALMEDAMEIGESLAANMMKAETPQDRLRYVIELSFEWILEHSDYSKTMTQLALQVGKFPVIQKMVDGKIQAWRTFFVATMRELGFEQPEMEAYCLGALFDGIGVQYVSVGDKIGLLKVKEFLIDKYCIQTLKP